MSQMDCQREYASAGTGVRPPCCRRAVQDHEHGGSVYDLVLEVGDANKHRAWNELVEGTPVLSKGEEIALPDVEMAAVLPVSLASKLTRRKRRVSLLHPSDSGTISRPQWGAIRSPLELSSDVVMTISVEILPFNAIFAA